MTTIDHRGQQQVGRGRVVRVGIVGGGASGTLVAARLLRQSVEPIEVVVFEPRARLGEGIAYSTRDPLHTLNVPACAMSALPEDPDHFRRWAGAADTDFVPRRDYGTYLRELLEDAAAGAAAGADLTHVRQAVASMGTSPQPWVVTDDHVVFEFDSIVLATGNDTPAAPEQIDPDVRTSPRFVADPWSSAAFDAIRPNDRVLVIGTGLTFVDVSLSLIDAVPGVTVQAVSRHGLIPQAHEDPWRPRHPAPDLRPDSVRPADVLAYVRSWGDDWRRGLDSLRPITSALWRGMDEAARSAFVRHLARRWDVHRHRTAPAVARALEEMLASGRVQVSAAELVSVALVDDEIITTTRDGRIMRTDHVVLCTGPSGDATRDPLGQDLISRGIAQQGPLGMGYLVAADSGALVNADSVPDSRILTIGPPRREVLWETTAMPEIRMQAAEVAERVIAALHVAA